MHRGYIKLWRRVSDNPLWTGEKFTRGQAWIDLIMLANHKDGNVRVRGIKVPVLRGQCGWSVLSLSDRWGWSRGKTTRFLNELETEQQIVQQKNRVTSLITIVNYDEYQEGSTTKQTTDGQQTDTNKNDKNTNNKNTIVSFLLKDGSEYTPDQKFISSLTDLYPNVNAESEFKKMAAWCLSNPGKRKTSRGAKKFINTWFSNSQERWDKENPPEPKRVYVNV